MYLTDKAQFFLGGGYPLKDVCTIHQLTIDEIYSEELGHAKYQYYLSLLTMEEDDIEEILKKKGTPKPDDLGVLEYLLISAKYDKSFFVDLKNAFSTFIKEDVIISTDSLMIIVGNPVEKRIITKDNIDEFQYGLRLINKMRVKEPPPPNETPMQKKFRLKKERREKVKEKTKAKQAADGEAMTLCDMLSSVCSLGIGYTAFNIGQLTIFQLKELLERSQARERYHTELDMLMAGADSKKIKPKSWYGDLDKD